MKTVILLFIISISLFSASLKISINGIDTYKKGRVWVFLFSEKNRELFPFGKGVKRSFYPKKITQKVVFRNLSKGQYAVAIFHDENSNRKLDENFLGFATEGRGFSNNSRFFESFRKSQININMTTSINIRMNY